MDRTADFFLSSGDSLEWSEPRDCIVERTLDDGYAFVLVHPAGPVGEERVVMRPRYEGTSLADVKVGRVVVDLFDADGFEDAHRRGQARRRHLGEIYPTRQAAAGPAEQLVQGYEFTRGGPPR